MGDDEFDDEFDDIPDEDLMLALTQATSVMHALPVAKSVIPQNTDNSRSSVSQFASSSAKAQHPNQVYKRPAPFPGNRNDSGTRQTPSHLDRVHPGGLDDHGFDDIPSDAFDSSPERSVGPPVRPLQRRSIHAQTLRQTTLWGNRLELEDQPPSQAASHRPFRSDLPPETPTHHELNKDALATWVYPMNLGEPRDYQFSIVKHGLFNNTLVALPTGLGKTFIAAAVMLNFVRWTKSAKIVFVAPTKPLASQQVQACLSIAGIPRSQATLLTGETPPVLREGEWESKRVFFMTPQTLMNDLSKGYADPKSIVLLVVDEAHRATGDYAYVKAVEFIRRFSQSFRVLALTATPGSSVEGVQDVIDNLGISHVEIRTEDSLDIRQYVHLRNIDTMTFDPSHEMLEVRDLFSKALKPLVSKLTSQNIYYGRDPMSLTTYGLLKARQEWMNGPGRQVNQGVKFMMMAVFSILQSLAHSIKLLNFHGIKPFYHSIAEFRSAEEGKGGTGSKLKRQLLGDEDFQKMVLMIEKWMKIETFNGHPKLAYLCETLVNHFMDAGTDSNTRAIVFSEYRDSAEEIVRILNHQPLISATVFVGQADSKRSEGMKQKQQIETIEKFKNGKFNVLVATSIGEEGLDIGQVDLIVCYDASASPIRMLQRMGRTGRKRAGNILLLLMKGSEEDKFLKAKDNYQKMQELICDGSSFAFRHELSSRIVPRDIRPEVDKRIVEIPLENSQNPVLPEPKKTVAGLRKKPAKKKFNMPDGVETGFITASMLGGFVTKQALKAPEPGPVELGILEEWPELDSVTLSKSQTAELDRLYRELPFRLSDMEDITAPSLTAHPAAQRTLRHTVKLKHGEHTKRCVKLFKRLGSLQDPFERDTRPFGNVDTSAWATLPVLPLADDTDGESVKNNLRTNKRPRATSLSKDEQGEPASVTRKKRQVSAAKGSKKRPQVTRDAPDCFELDDDGNDGEEGDDMVDEEPNLSPPARRSRRSSAGWGKKRRAGRTTLKRRGDDLEDYGDDCTRTSDMEKTDGSDSGADLEGFVVDDAMATSSMRRRSTSPTTPASSALTIHGDRRKAVRDQGLAVTPVGEKPFFVPMQFTQTQEATDDDMPDFATLVAKSKGTGTPLGQHTRMASTMDMGVQLLEEEDDDDDDDDDDVVIRTPVKRKRPILADSDDED
ncbi:hypothetical protein B0H66DRAFT_51600 [Apodospora peruviana]|uniref:ATP-dependent DNA helicase n=1 Tax=Apodospora peruviana TaxID=516989 RepID=A0AAE0ITF1_9PEZI|nr:hypothetical protein B0H66DRAFT_51600 [Apodospora peruviana]